MNRIVVCLSVFATIGQAATVTLPNQILTYHSAEFSDPQGNSLTGGKAYDREKNQIGVNRTQTNTALAKVTPARLTSRVQFVSAAANTASVAQVQTAPDKQTLTVTGVNRGETSVYAQRSPFPPLGVFVFTPFQRSIAIHIINNSVTTAQAQAALALANTTWGDQTNITFGPNPTIDEISVTGLGTSLDVLKDSISSEEQAVINAAKNTGVAINIYIVNSIQVAGLPAGTFADGLTRLGLGDILIGANSSTLNLTVAHELGHALGLTKAKGNADYETSRQYQLMFFNTSRGSTIAPDQGDSINSVH